jgi:hypothetical protein
MVACKSSSKNAGKMSLIPVFNKTLPRAHIELELDVLPRKACEICSSLIQKKIIAKKLFSLFFFIQAVQIAIDQFLVSRNFRG